MNTATHASPETNEFPYPTENPADAEYPIAVTLTPWRAVPLFWLDSARALNDAERLTALAAYRSTGGMYLVVMAEPTGYDSPEECERLSEAGPGVEEIDWTGFDD